MNEKYFSIIDFCQSLLFCRKRKTDNSFEEITAKSILEQILRKRSKPTNLQTDTNIWLSASSPNLYAESQVNGNFSNKPTISIKTTSLQSTKLEREFSTRNNFKSLNIDYRNTLNKKEKKHSFKKENKININSRHKSFKYNQKFFQESLSYKPSCFTSCPHINHLVRLEDDQDSGNSDSSLYDNVDDFTTNLFIDISIPDENNYDLVSINFD